MKKFLRIIRSLTNTLELILLFMDLKQFLAKALKIFLINTVQLLYYDNELSSLKVFIFPANSLLHS